MNTIMTPKMIKIVAWPLLSVLVGIIITLAGGWAKDMNSRVGANTVDIVVLKETAAKRGQQADDIQRALQRIEDKLDNEIAYQHGR